MVVWRGDRLPEVKNGLSLLNPPKTRKVTNKPAPKHRHTLGSPNLKTRRATFRNPTEPRGTQKLVVQSRSCRFKTRTPSSTPSSIQIRGVKYDWSNLGKNWREPTGNRWDRSVGPQSATANAISPNCEQRRNERLLLKQYQIRRREIQHKTDISVTTNTAKCRR